jgi:hypothetical protein
MSQTGSNFWVMAELTMLDRQYPTLTKTIRLVNRPTLSSTPNLYMPLLQAVPGIGSRAGDFLPPASSATITIDDQIGSWGYQRRFSDFFDRYDLIDQQIVIYIAETAPDILDPQSSFSAYWRGTVQSFRKTLTGQKPSVILNISRADIPVNVVTKVITSDEFPTAPIGNLGKAIPLVFGAAGTIDVQPLQITESSTITDFAYCTTFADKALPIGVSSRLVADEKGEYISFVSGASSAETPELKGNSPNATVTRQNWEVAETERNITFGYADGNWAVVGLKMYFHDNIDATRAGTLRFKVLKAKAQHAFPSQLLRLGETIHSSEIDYADLTLEGTFGGINVYYAKVIFPQPIAFDTSINTYSISVSRTATTDNIRPITDSSTTAATQGLVHWWYNGSAWTNLTTGNSPYIDVYAVQFDENITPSAAEINQSTGLGHSRVRVTIKNGFISPILCDAGKMNWLLKIGGLKDNAAGFFTGTSDFTLNKPKRIADLLTSTWANGAWTPAANYDRTKFSDSHSPTGFDIIITGRTSSIRTARQVLLDVLRNSFTRIASQGGAVKNLGLYGYGYTQTSVTTIDDEDAKIVSIEFGGTQTIVNRCLMYYDNQLDKIKDVRPLSSDGSYKEYQASYDTSKDTTGVTGAYAALIARSQGLYGVRDLSQQAFDFLSYRASTTSAAAVAKAIIQQFSDPDITIRFQIPFYKYQTLKIFDVIRLSHPDLPSHLGTSSEAHLPLTSGTGVDLTRGEYFKRAKDYRLLIEGIDLQLSSGTIPVLDLSCKVITGGNVT